MVDVSLITTTSDGGYDIDAFAFGTAGEYFDLCASEPYLDQPVPGFCSGFVVGSDLIVTAGHCITGPPDCASTAFAFGFLMNDPKTPVTHVGADDVYFCAEIVDRIDDGSLDYALIRTDRDIVGHPALPVRRTGAVEDLPPGEDELHVVGHPMGMPAKLAGGANAQPAGTPDWFAANLDVYAGNSGSAVVSLDSSGEFYRAEGVLVRGNDDFVSAGSCNVTVVCSDTAGCSGATAGATA